MNRREALRALAAVSVAGLGPLTSSSAQTRYPDRAVRLVVPRAPGGVVDVVGRQWADQVKASLGTIVIENQGGGGGTIGTAAVARAAPDGYTLLLGSTSDLVLNPIIMRQLSYDPVRDFAPIYNLAISVPTIAVNPSVPARTLAELVAHAKANPGRLSYGSPGAGTMANLCGELLKQLAGIPDLVHVPYKGGANGINDLIEGHIPIMATNVSRQMMELQAAGKIRILVLATDKRLAGVPGIPNAVDAGFPGLVAESSMGLFAPAKTPQEIVDQIAEVTRKVMADKDFTAKLTVAGFEPITDSAPQSAAKYLRDEVGRWGPVLQAAGMKEG